MIPERRTLMAKKVDELMKLMLEREKDEQDAWAQEEDEYVLNYVQSHVNLRLCQDGEE